MRTLREVLLEADARHVAVGHFNISELAALKGIFGAAIELSEEGKGKTEGGVPILIGVSEGEREFIGVRTVAAVIKSMRAEFGYPIYLNADHTHSLDKVRAAAEAGFDEIIFDASALPMEENIRQTKEAVKIIRSIDPNIVIEGEIGYIGSNSEVMEKKPDHIALSTPDEAVRFVDETGIDVLAPAVGNMHGLLKEMAEGKMQKRLDIGRIGEIKKAIVAALAARGSHGAGSWMTLHGGSGTADQDFTAAIRAGMDIVHVSTELRLAWRRGVVEGLHAHPDEVAPYKILPPAVEGIMEIVKQRLRLFNDR
ncbi:MAG: class II fructose-bisphosphate aldolase [Patescibacteria group bacterium]|nr:class II fructose-bisphosphate aldolase [Patescibacteria group bacterium]